MKLWFAVVRYRDGHPAALVVQDAPVAWRVLESCLAELSGRRISWRLAWPLLQWVGRRDLHASRELIELPLPADHPWVASLDRDDDKEEQDADL